MTPTPSGLLVVAFLFLSAEAASYPSGQWNGAIAMIPTTSGSTSCSSSCDQPITSTGHITWMQSSLSITFDGATVPSRPTDCALNPAIFVIASLSSLPNTTNQFQGFMMIGSLNYSACVYFDDTQGTFAVNLTLGVLCELFLFSEASCVSSEGSAAVQQVWSGIFSRKLR
jgi:hypothetical protein